MPSSWSESNRLHSSNMREESASAELNDYEDDFADDSYLDGDFSIGEPIEDRYLDAQYEDRYDIDIPYNYEY